MSGSSGSNGNSRTGNARRDTNSSGGRGNLHPSRRNAPAPAAAAAAHAETSRQTQRGVLPAAPPIASTLVRHSPIVGGAVTRGGAGWTAPGLPHQQQHVWVGSSGGGGVGRASGTASSSSGGGSSNGSCGTGVAKKVKPQVNTRAAVGFLKSSKRIREARLKEEQERQAVGTVTAAVAVAGTVAALPAPALDPAANPVNSRTLEPLERVSSSPTPRMANGTTTAVNGRASPASPTGASALAVVPSARSRDESLEGSSGRLAMDRYRGLARNSDSEAAVAARVAAAVEAVAGTATAATGLYPRPPGFASSASLPPQHQQQHSVTALPAPGSHSSSSPGVSTSLPQRQRRSQRDITGRHGGPTLTAPPLVQTNRTAAPAASGVLRAGLASGAAAEPWAEENRFSGTGIRAAHLGLVGHRGPGGGGRGELWASDASDELYGGRTAGVNYVVQEHATPTSEPKVVLLLEEQEVGVLRAAVSGCCVFCYSALALAAATVCLQPAVVCLGAIS